MNMIDQYIFEVGENLPEKLRADLEKEIRSLIEDTLEERSRTYSRAIDDDMIAEVLKEFGPPERMAASYQPQKYLIGPKLYPTFILVLKDCQFHCFCHGSDRAGSRSSPRQELLFIHF